LIIVPIRGADVIHVGRSTFLVDRAQTMGPGGLSIPTETIKELGNYRSVATVRDTPDLSSSLSSFDVTSETEQMLTGSDGTENAVYAAYTADNPASFDFSSVNKTFTVNDGDGVTTTVTLTTNTTNQAGFISAVNGQLITGVNDVRVVVSTAGRVAYKKQTIGLGTVTLAGTNASYFNVNGVATAGVDGYIDLTTASTFDLVGHFMPGVNAASPFAVVSSCALPLLFPERISYRFGVGQNSTIDVSLRSDSIYYTPKPAVVSITAGSGSAGQSIALTNAGLYDNNGTLSRTLSVSVDGQRLVEGTDFNVTGDAGSGTPFDTVAVVLVDAVAATSSISIVYFSNDAVSFVQASHPDSTVKPAAIKGRSVRLYIGASYDRRTPEGSAAFRIKGVQTATLDWSVQVIRDLELGNANAWNVEADDTPSVNGTVAIRARDVDELFDRLRTITGVSDTDKAIGPDNAVELALDIVILDSDGTVWKRLHVADARFSLPGYSAQVGQRVDFELPWVSDSGTVLVYEA
jgi:hypothetical protein